MAKTPEERRAAQIAYLKAYRQRPEVKERNRQRYEALRADPEWVEGRKAYLRDYYRDNHDAVSEQQREYAQRPEVKERRRGYAAAYYQRPGVKARQQEYYQRPEVKEHRRQYYAARVQRPEAEHQEVSPADKERLRAYNKAYYEAKKQDPEWVERRREYMRQYNARKKAERDAAKVDAPQNTDPIV